MGSLPAPSNRAGAHQFTQRTSSRSGDRVWIAPGHRL